MIDEQAKMKGVVLSLIYPTKCDTPLWPLDNGQKFGYGTTFGKFNMDFTYHAFESNAKHHSSSKFIEKCKSILSSNQ